MNEAKYSSSATSIARKVGETDGRPLKAIAPHRTLPHTEAVRQAGLLVGAADIPR